MATKPAENKNKSLLEKRHVEDTPTSRSKDIDQKFKDGGGLEAPIDPNVLCKLFELSPYLRPNVDAYTTNIDGFGHRFVPLIDVESEDAFENVKTGMMIEAAYEIEAIREMEAGTDKPEVPGHEDDHAGDNQLEETATDDENIDKIKEPADSEVEARIAKINKQMKIEKWRLDAAFKNFVDEVSFVELRKWVRADKEITGAGYIEIRRSIVDNKPMKMTYIPGCTMRPTVLGGEFVTSKTREMTSPLSHVETEYVRKFRKFVQVVDQDRDAVYYKEYGDPRIMSARTGRYFEDRAEWDAHMADVENTDQEATEVLYFPVHSPSTSMGVPRWIGCTPEVLGSRETSEVNLLHFKNNTIPAMAVLVSGGKLAKGSAKKIEDFMENTVKGRQSFDKTLIIEAETGFSPLAESNKNPRIELKPLSRREDALFMDYDKANERKIQHCFRNPSFLLGDTEKTNFATAQVARMFAEEQVYQPERESFDHVINQTIMVDLKSKFYKFATNAPLMKNPELLTKMVSELVKTGVLIPDEGREIAEDIFNREFQNIKDPWTKRPMQITLIGVNSGVSDLNGNPVQPDENGMPTETVEEPDMESNGTEDLGKRLAGVVDPMQSYELIKISQEAMDELVEPE